MTLVVWCGACSPPTLVVIPALGNSAQVLRGGGLCLWCMGHGWPPIIPSWPFAMLGAIMTLVVW